MLGINSRDQLAAAEAIFQRRARLSAMRDGVTLIAPETVWLSYDTRLGRDVIIEPNVFFGPGVTVEDGAEIKANCYIERSHIGRAARVGPFARLRPNANLGAHVHVGNFVEVKNSTLGEGAKANHLSYLGDGDIGEGANIGAGTIFCNYDGFNKHRTEIGAGAFVGSNSSLVAPVKIGAGAYIGSGSVITEERGGGRARTRAVGPGGAPRLGGEVPRHDGAAQDQDDMTREGHWLRGAATTIFPETQCDLRDMLIKRYQYSSLRKV